MVKINKTLGLALLTALAASCSSNEEAVQNNPTVENNGTAYAKIRIELPTQQGSRANDVFDDGMKSEYAVNNAVLYVFQAPSNASSEGAYTFVSKSTLGDMKPWNVNSSSDITTEADVVAELKNVSVATTAPKYFGLVVLNGTGKFTEPTDGQSFEDWSKTAITNDKYATNEGGLFMANATRLSDGTPLTLVEIPASSIKNTAAAAEAAPAADVYVERGAAKVTMTKDKADIAVTSTTYKDAKVELQVWDLDVTNKKTFPVHYYTNLATDYSGIWTVARFAKTTDFKRLYWAEDPNYTAPAVSSSDLSNDDFNYLSGTPALTEKFGDTNPRYCMENTFNVDHMVQGQSTRVVIKAVFKQDGTHATTFYKLGGGRTIYNATALASKIQDAITQATSKDGSNYTITLKATGNDITSTAGAVTLSEKNFSVATGKTADTITAADASAIQTYLGGITCYPGGVCYYKGIIKHFGDDLTPWTYGEKYSKGHGGTDNKNDFLGRYGVVRNNWYSLSVNTISGPGTPTVPTIDPDEPDDETEQYISLGVKILSWAKRTQSLDL